MFNLTNRPMRTSLMHRYWTISKKCSRWTSQHHYPQVIWIQHKSHRHIKCRSIFLNWTFQTSQHSNQPVTLPFHFSTAHQRIHTQQCQTSHLHRKTRLSPSRSRWKKEWLYNVIKIPSAQIAKHVRRRCGDEMEKEVSSATPAISTSGKTTENVHCPLEKMELWRETDVLEMSLQTLQSGIPIRDMDTQLLVEQF